MTMDTPESIRDAYPAAENETPEQRRKRLASKRAAKYRYYSKVDGERREQHKERQRKWRETLDDSKRHAIREQNRLRQQARRDKMTADDKHRRNQQQRHRRAAMDDQELLQLRERERLRMRRRREQQPSPTPESTPPPPPHREPMATKRRLSSSPLIMGGFAGQPPPLPTAMAVLPPAAALGSSSSILRAEGAISDQLPASLRHQSQHHHHPPIGIAPLQFVLPPASSIQSLTFADRMAPLPQVQNVLPHASTLLHAAGVPSGGSQLQVSASMQLPSSSGVSASVPGMANATGSSAVAVLNPPYMFVPSSSSSLGSLLNPPLPSLPPCSTTTSISAATTTTVMPQIQPPAVLPSLSQLPDLYSTTTTTRDFFDSSSTSASGFFPSIAEFTSDLETRAP